MASGSLKGSSKMLTKRVYYSGYSYNATPASRAALSDTVKNGYVVCADPTAMADRTYTKLDPKAIADPGIYSNIVTKPATGILPLVVGIVVDLPAGGRSGPGWLTVATMADEIDALLLGNFTAYTDLLIAANGAWSLAPAAVGTNGANIPISCGNCLQLANYSSAANGRIRFRAPYGGIGE